MSEVDSNIPPCCLEHLQRRGHGVIIRVTSDGASKVRFLINPMHCIDGARARCITCRRVWEHVCGGDGEDCHWICRSTRKARRATKK